MLHLDVVGRLTEAGQAGSNPVAAMPSLHAGAALLVALFLWPSVSRAVARSRWRRTPSRWALTLVYTGEHYVVDVLAGWAVAVLAILVAGPLGRWVPSQDRGPSRDPAEEVADEHRALARPRDQRTRPSAVSWSRPTPARRWPSPCSPACSPPPRASTPGTAALVVAAVLAGQLSVGWSNDLVDVGRDRRAGRTDKPLATGEASLAVVRGACARGRGRLRRPLARPRAGPRAHPPRLRRVGVGLQPRPQGDRVVVAPYAAELRRR